MGVQDQLPRQARVAIGRAVLEVAVLPIRQAGAPELQESPVAEGAPDELFPIIQLRQAGGDQFAFIHSAVAIPVREDQGSQVPLIAPGAGRPLPRAHDRHGVLGDGQVAGGLNRPGDCVDAGGGPLGGDQIPKFRHGDAEQQAGHGQRDHELHQAVAALRRRHASSRLGEDLAPALRHWAAAGRHGRSPPGRKSALRRGRSRVPGGSERWMIVAGRHGRIFNPPGLAIARGKFPQSA